MANKAYIYRLYPNDKQSRLIDQTIGCCRFVYNQSLTWRESAYNADKTSLSYDDTAYGLTKIKKLYPWLRDVDSISLQQSLRHLDTAYHNFFAVKKTGFPKYKSKHKCRLSYTTVVTSNNITIGDNFIKLPKGQENEKGNIYSNSGSSSDRGGNANTSSRETTDQQRRTGKNMRRSRAGIRDMSRTAGNNSRKGIKLLYIRKERRLLRIVSDQFKVAQRKNGRSGSDRHV